MIRIEKNKTAILISYALFAVCLSVCVLFAAYLFRSETDRDGTAFLIFGIFPMLLSAYIVVTAHREYELTEAGITKYGIFHHRRYYPWETFPYCYVVFFWDNKIGPYSNIVLSKTQIDHKTAKKIRYRFIPKPQSVICIGHTQERVDKLRALRPELHIEYRNHYLAKGHRKWW